MSKDKLKRTAKQQASATETKKISFSDNEATILGVREGGDEAPHVNLKYYGPEHECFSSWTADELKSFSAFCRKLSETSWQDIYKSAGSSGDKSGFGYTPHKDRSVLPDNPKLSKLSPDLTWHELRVTGTARVHGFRCKNAFFLVYLDAKHQIYRD